MNLVKSLVTIILMVLLLGCGEETKQLASGEPVPEFTLEKLNGEKINFPADFQGKTVSIRFWADWCPFCESEMKQLEPVYQKYQDNGLVILAVNVRQDKETAGKFISKLGISYDTLLDGDGSVARNYGVMGLPTSFFVDQDGVLKRRILGESTPETFEKIVQELLQQEAG